MGVPRRGMEGFLDSPRLPARDGAVGRAAPAGRPRMPVSHHDWIAHHAARRPDAVAVVDLAGGRSLGYREFDRRLTRLAGHLRDACGIKPGARVALMAQNGT